MASTAADLYLEFGILFVFDPAGDDVPPDDFPPPDGLWAGTSSIMRIAQHGVDGEVAVRVTDEDDVRPGLQLLGAVPFTVTSGTVAVSGAADWSVEASVEVPPGTYRASLYGEETDSPGTVDVVLTRTSG